MNKVKTIFVGTSDFAVPILDSLIKLNYIDLVAVVTQPDKPVGRKQVLQASPVKKFIQNTYPEILVEQPERIKNESDELLQKYQPELIIVASYGQIIPKNILNFPKFKCLNIHGSILPKLRGAVPIQMSILQDFKITGVTLQRMVFEMDEGPIISTREVEISQNETSESLTKKLSELGASLINQDLKSWIKGELQERPQNDSIATYCYKTDISKENAEIKFDTHSELAEKMVRAFYPWPVAWFTISTGKYAGKKVKIFAATRSERREMRNEKRVARSESSSQQPEAREGMQIQKDGEKLFLTLKNGELELLEIQLEGKERRGAGEYLWIE